MIIIDQPMNIRVDLDSNIGTMKPPKNETVGTLVVTDAGLGFKIPRGKREPELVIPWDKMVQAVEILKNVPGFTVPSNAPLDVDFTKVRDAKPSDFDIGIDCSGPNAEDNLNEFRIPDADDHKTVERTFPERDDMRNDPSCQPDDDRHLDSCYRPEDL